MKWLFYEKETNTRAKVVLIYHVEPPEELLNKGNYITATNIEEPEQKTGKTALPYCNPETGDFWYEYIDRPLTPEELANQKIQEQQTQIDELTLLIGDMILGGAM